MEIIGIIIVAIFVNNVVLAQFLGICPFLGVSKKVDTAIGMGLAVTFVLTIATIVTFLLQKGVLEPSGLGYLQTISFILVIAALVQMVEIVLKKISPSLYQALVVIQKDYNLLESVIYAVATAIGYAMALIIFSSIREQLALTRVPKAMEGIPLALITAGIMAMAFMGFSGIDQVFK